MEASSPKSGGSQGRREDGDDFSLKGGESSERRSDGCDGFGNRLGSWEKKKKRIKFELVTNSRPRRRWEQFQEQEF